MSAKVDYDCEPDPDHEDPLPDVIWYRVDGHSNGRWLYVDHPNAYYGGVLVGIQGVYRKELSSAEARAMADALLRAADEWDVLKADEDAKRERFLEAVRRCEEELGGHEWPVIEDWHHPPANAFICTRCGSQPRTVAYGT